MRFEVSFSLVISRKQRIKVSSFLWTLKKMYRWLDNTKTSKERQLTLKQIIPSKGTLLQKPVPKKKWGDVNFIYKKKNFPQSNNNPVCIVFSKHLTFTSRVPDNLKFYHNDRSKEISYRVFCGTNTKSVIEI